MVEALEAFKDWEEAKKNELNYKTSTKPPPYVYIKVN